MCLLAEGADLSRAWQGDKYVALQKGWCSAWRAGTRASLGSNLSPSGTTCVTSRESFNHGGPRFSLYKMLVIVVPTCGVDVKPDVCHMGGSIF